MLEWVDRCFSLAKNLAALGAKPLLVTALLLAVPTVAVAGTAKIVNGVIVYRAGNGEVNTIQIDPDGSALDQATGQFVRGITLRDSTASVFGGPGCRILQGAAVCDSTATRVSLDLRDKDDSLSQVQFPSRPLPMSVKGGIGRDTLKGGTGDDILDGEAGDDTIDGGDGADILIGGLGDDTLTGGPGVDRFNGGAGKDTIDSKDGNAEIVDCGIGRDTVSADPDDDQRQCRI